MNALNTIQDDPFDWGYFNLDGEWWKQFYDVQDLLNASIDHAKQVYKLNRKDIADRMTKKLKTPINENMINKWTKNDGNRFPLEYAHAFAIATRDPRILMYTPSMAGLSVLTRKEKMKFDAFQYREMAAIYKAKADMLDREVSQ